jgi:electron transfer flavoprotein alpha subunit
MDLALAANCTDVEPGGTGDAYTLTRIRWGGSLLEHARLHGAVKLFTVAPQSVAAAPVPAPQPASVQTFTPALTEADLRVRVARRETATTDRVSLSEARVVIGGGRGVGSAEGFKSLEALAELLGGAVGCSRAATSLGWRPHAEQIGQTGTRIAPELYVACGVSGAIQHWVGCRGAKVVLAINTDREAPIVTQAHYAVIGDLHQVLAAVCAEIGRVQAR